MDTGRWLIADAGATGTEFSVLEDGRNIFHFIGSGINPNYHADEEIVNVFLRFTSQFEVVDTVTRVYFYGAGCASATNEQRMERIVSSIFPSAEVCVYSDLMAVCHALCHHKPAIVAILGTGSSSCRFDGETIVERAPSLGYLLGDEGSGTDLGKRFIKQYLTGQLPAGPAALFENEWKTTPAETLSRLYRNDERPNRFFASLSPFVGAHIDHPFIRQMCFRAFDDFFAAQMQYYKNHNDLIWQISGSVGFFFKEIVREVAEHRQCTIDNIVQSPVIGLLDYYKSLESWHKSAQH